MLDSWSLLSEELQLALSREALRRASILIADQADELAIEMEIGGLADRGGAEALRLLAAMVRFANDDTLIPVGTS
jgi:hypothetical protein